MPFVSFLDKSAGLGALLVHDPARYGSFLEIGKNIMTGPSELEVGDRELIAAYVSVLNECAFCAGTHTAIANAFGRDPELLQALLVDPATAPMDSSLVPVMNYARKLTLESARLTQADADAVIAAGWSEQVLSDIVAVTAYFAMANRLATGHGIEALPPQDNDAIGQLVAKQGYPGVESLPKPTGDGVLQSW